MTGLAIVGLVLFGLVIGLMAVAFLQETVRGFRGLKRATVRVRFGWRGDTDPVLDRPNGLQERLQLLAGEESRERLDPEIKSGWGFDQ
jgi:hypothetical protein